MRKASEIKARYMRERRRIQSIIYRAEKKENRIVDRTILPAIPKKITEASVRRLKGITAKDVQEKAVTWYDPETGEILGTGRQAINKERSENRKKQKIEWLPSVAEFVMREIEMLLAQHSDPSDKKAYNPEAVESIESMIGNARNSMTEQEFGKLLNDEEESILSLIRIILRYKDLGRAATPLAQLFAIFADRPITDSEYKTMNAGLSDEDGWEEYEGVSPFVD